MPDGFKIADGYVEVHADYDRGELRRAAKDAADDFGDEFGRESSQEATRSFKKDFQKNFADNFDKDGRITSVTAQRMVHGLITKMQDEVDRQKGPIEKTGRSLGQRLADGVRKGLHSVNYIDTTIKRRLERNFSSGGDGAGSSFVKRFIEAVTLGMADLPGARPRSMMAAKFAKLGTLGGVVMAVALAAKLAQAITALLPIALGGALLAIPIADLIARNVDLEKGKLSFKKNPVGAALRDLIRTAQKLADTLGKVFKGPFISGLKSATALMKQLVVPMSQAVKAISPGALAMWRGFLGAIRSFGTAFAPALKGINAGLKQWGIELPKIGSALGKMFSTILGNQELVRKSVTGFSSLVQWVLKAAGAIITFLTYVAAAADSFNRLINIFERGQNAFLGMPGWIQRIREAFGPLGTAIKAVWEAFKRFATATTDEQVVERWRIFIDKLKALWPPLKDAIAKVWGMIWTKIKGIWDTKVVSWWEGTAKPWLKEKFKAAMTEAGNLLVQAAKAKFEELKQKAKNKISEMINNVVTKLKSLPGKAVSAIASLPGKIGAKIQEAATKAKTKAKALVDGVVTFLKGLPGKAASAVSSLWSRMSGAFSSAVSNAKAKGRALLDGFIAAIRSLPSKAASVVGRAKSAIIAKFSGAAGWLKNAGSQIIQGLARGISAGVSYVRDAAAAAGRAALAAVKSALGITSPSKVFAEQVGVPAAQGIAVGLQKQFPLEMKDLRTKLPNLGMAPAHASATGQAHGAAFSPTVNLYMQPGFYSENAAAKRALTKDVFLALEQYRKDYIDR